MNIFKWFVNRKETYRMKYTDIDNNEHCSVIEFEWKGGNNTQVTFSDFCSPIIATDKRHEFLKDIESVYEKYFTMRIK